jgi:hypothetical protein
MPIRPMCLGPEWPLYWQSIACAPGCELAVEQRWYPSTALDDLLGIEEGKINDTRLYRCLNRILPHKTKLEYHLKQRYGELFGAEFDLGYAATQPVFAVGACRHQALLLFSSFFSSSSAMTWRMTSKASAT